MVQLKKVPVSELARQNDITRAACYLYVISEIGTGYYKIGIAGHPARRLSGLQCGNHRHLEIVLSYEGSRASCARVEAAALRFFRARAGSEWVNPEQASDIEAFLSAFEVAQ